jgi:hypothetical protein
VQAVLHELADVLQDLRGQKHYGSSTVTDLGVLHRY